MKKIVLFIIFGSLLFSCSTSKTIIKSKKIIKGDWILNNISYSEIGTYKVTLLNDVSKECFEGSTWHFITNNYTGNYTINKENCAIGNRYFRFAIQEIDKDTGLYDFMLKPTNEKYKSESNRGFRLKLSQLSDVSMQWQQSLNIDGKPFIINMNFSKK